MSEKYDLVVFGATGFTGQFVAIEVAKRSKEEGITWAVAGRCQEKLQKVLERVAKEAEVSTENVGVIVADVEKEDSLVEMAQKSRVVLNCVGPYRFYGEAVVKACVQNCCHHVDISGEPQFLERMQLNYNDLAQDKKVYVVGACGFDSIPTDMGIVYLDREFKGDVNGVESYLAIQAPKGAHGHFATWQSAIYGFAHANELKPLRRQLYPERLPEFTPRLKPRSALHFNEIVQAWCLPFPGSDRSVVMRSQRYFYEHKRKRPIQMHAYVQRDSWFNAIATMMGAVIFGVMASFSFTRSLLEKYPSFFSFGIFNHEGPSKEEMENTNFSITIAGSGWTDKLAEPTDQHADPPNKTLVVKVSGPEPGYVATPICMVQSALVILKENAKLPNDGGVLAPAAAFADTGLIERLNKHGVKFEKLSEHSKGFPQLEDEQPQEPKDSEAIQDDRNTLLENAQEPHQESFASPAQAEVPASPSELASSPSEAAPVSSEATPSSPEAQVGES